ncbi:ABC transporter permease [Seohaeicola zhoushanensis]|uniref:ABC transporter permease n=1 Tax=Seohaeicola zhoushanensis TaxID=1569283 RepID=A0A8J3GYJ8_9RHOB|nr:ABC transporter permease [Seohaeicola zhoushanensis]GHF51773.1 ABC transporter permease [Seohaeicola zhoushanensis]
MRGLLTLLLPLALWQAVSALGLLPPFVLPSPLRVAEVLVAERALLAGHFLVTFGEVTAGLAIGVTLGAATAIVMCLSPPALRLLGPLLVTSQALPVFVLAPILTIWLGYGPAPKIAMTVLLVFFPVASGLLDGLRGTPAEVLDLARIARAGRLRELHWLRLPHALPHLGAGLRIAVTYAPTGAVIGEWVGASKGLGYLMLMANARMRVELMFAALVLIVLMTLLLNRGTHHLLRRWSM